MIESGVDNAKASLYVNGMSDQHILIDYEHYVKRYVVTKLINHVDHKWISGHLNRLEQSLRDRGLGHAISRHTQTQTSGELQDSEGNPAA